MTALRALLSIVFVMAGLATHVILYHCTLPCLCAFVYLCLCAVNWLRSLPKVNNVFSGVITQKVYWLITIMCSLMLYGANLLNHSTLVQFRGNPLPLTTSPYRQNILLTVLHEIRSGELSLIMSFYSEVGAINNMTLYGIRV